MPTFTPTPARRKRRRPAAASLYAGSENWDRAPGWLQRATGQPAAPYPMYAGSRGWDTRPGWLDRAVAANKRLAQPSPGPRATARSRSAGPLFPQTMGAGGGAYDIRPAMPYQELTQFTGKPETPASLAAAVQADWRQRGATAPAPAPGAPPQTITQRYQQQMMAVNPQLARVAPGAPDRPARQPASLEDLIGPQAAAEAARKQRYSESLSVAGLGPNVRVPPALPQQPAPTGADREREFAGGRPAGQAAPTVGPGGQISGMSMHDYVIAQQEEARQIRSGELAPGQPERVGAWQHGEAGAVQTAVAANQAARGDLRSVMTEEEAAEVAREDYQARGAARRTEGLVRRAVRRGRIPTGMVAGATVEEAMRPRQREAMEARADRLKEVQRLQTSRAEARRTGRRPKTLDQIRSQMRKEKRLAGYGPAGAQRIKSYEEFVDGGGKPEGYALYTQTHAQTNANQSRQAAEQREAGREGSTDTTIQEAGQRAYDNRMRGYGPQQPGMPGRPSGPRPAEDVNTTWKDRKNVPITEVLDAIDANYDLDDPAQFAHARQLLGLRNISTNALLEQLEAETPGAMNAMFGTAREYETWLNSLWSVFGVREGEAAYQRRIRRYNFIRKLATKG